MSELNFRSICLTAMAILVTLPGCDDSKKQKKTRATAQQAAPQTLLASALRLLNSDDRSDESFRIASQRLNRYLALSKQDKSLVRPVDQTSLDFLSSRLSTKQAERLTELEFTRQDGEHIEACFLTNAISSRLTENETDKLKMVSMIFDWTVENIQLLPKVIQRPFLPPRHVLLSGMGYKEERAWVFMDLLRQIEVTSLTLNLPGSNSGKSEETDPSTPTSQLALVAVLVEGQFYLFDTTNGIPIPGKEKGSIATLSDVVSEPDIANAMKIDELGDYPLNSENISKLGARLNSYPTYWAPRMKFLQERLAGKNRVLLYEELAQTIATVKTSLPENIDIQLWELPLDIDIKIRTFAYDRQLKETQTPYVTLPAFLHARKAHLHGNFAEAIKAYMKHRINPKKTLAEQARIRLRTHVQRIKREPLTKADDERIQQILVQIYQNMREDATYFMGLLKYEEREYEIAEHWLSKLYLGRYPKGKWVEGSNFNLGVINSAQDDSVKAREYFEKAIGDDQARGNRIRAQWLGGSEKVTDADPASDDAQ